MRPVRIGAILATLAGCALLTACAGNATRGSDDTGDLGAAELNSPGDVYVAMAAEYYRRGQLEVALQRAQKGLDRDWILRWLGSYERLLGEPLTGRFDEIDPSR